MDVDGGVTSCRSILEKPLSQLTEEDITQLTREDCRKFLKEKGEITETVSSFFSLFALPLFPYFSGTWAEGL